MIDATSFGDLTPENHSDSTASVSYTCGRMGRTKTVSDVTGTRTFTYGASSGLALSEEDLSDSFYGSASTRDIEYLYEGSGANRARYDTPNYTWQHQFKDYTWDAAGNPTNYDGQSYSVNSLNEIQPSETEDSPYTYDADGNLTGDGTWTYSCDANNRIKTMSGSFYYMVFKYDYMGRRVQKAVSTLTFWNLYTYRYAYSGMELIAELDSGGGLRKTFHWGLDKSDTRGGSGGAGGAMGLVMMRDHSTGSSYYPAYDMNGNVTGMMDSSGAFVAWYEYDAFGKLLTSDGSYATSNPIRYSTQYTDNESGLVYYGFRYYDPSKGRFLNRDPLGESGGLNLYKFVGNDPVHRVDKWGLCEDPGPRPLDNIPDYAYSGSDEEFDNFVIDLEEAQMEWVEKANEYVDCERNRLRRQDLRIAQGNLKTETMLLSFGPADPVSEDTGRGGLAQRGELRVGVQIPINRMGESTLVTSDGNGMMTLGETLGVLTIPYHMSPNADGVVTPGIRSGDASFQVMHNGYGWEFNAIGGKWGPARVGVGLSSVVEYGTFTQGWGGGGIQVNYWVSTSNLLMGSVGLRLSSSEIMNGRVEYKLNGGGDVPFNYQLRESGYFLIDRSGTVQDHARTSTWQTTLVPFAPLEDGQRRAFSPDQIRRADSYGR